MNPRYMLFFLCFLCLSATQSVAQLVQGSRIEFERKNDIEEENILLPLKEKGVVLVQSKIEVYRQKLSLEFHKFDSTLIYF